MLCEGVRSAAYPAYPAVPALYPRVRVHGQYTSRPPRTATRTVHGRGVHVSTGREHAGNTPGTRREHAAVTSASASRGPIRPGRGARCRRPCARAASARRADGGLIRCSASDGTLGSRARSEAGRATSGGQRCARLRRAFLPPNLRDSNGTRFRLRRYSARCRHPRLSVGGTDGVTSEAGGV